jgi:ribosomal protein S18 acetylase RimI-like enzyme
MATDPARQRRGVGNAVLAALCADLGDAHGVERAEISWVGPVGFYAKAGAHVGRVFRLARLPL